MVFIGISKYASKDHRRDGLLAPKIREMVITLQEKQIIQPNTSEDVGNILRSVIPQNEFSERCREDHFNAIHYLTKLRLTSCDTERLFSSCRVSKNYLNFVNPPNANITMEKFF